MDYSEKTGRAAVMLLAAGGLALSAVPAAAQGQYRNIISHNSAACASGTPSVRVTISGVKSNSGTMRVQLYKGTKADWLESGRWLNRIELPARAGTMTVCMPVPAAGTYAIAIRHDTNNNGKTDLSQDGGAMSNNPSINIWNLGKPSYTKTKFPVGNTVKSLTVRMKYA